MTVSRVLNAQGKARVTEETRNRVLRVVRELEYMPVGQPVTQSRRVETRTLGLVFDGMVFEGHWGVPTFWGLQEAAMQYDYDLLTLLRLRPGWMMNQAELQFLDRRSDALIFLAPMNRRTTMENLVKHKLPVLACYTNDFPESVPSVLIDNFGALQLAVRHLVNHGHQRILHLTTLAERSDFKARRQGYEQAMASAGIEPLVFGIDHSLLEESRAKLCEVIRLRQATAIACASDNLATFAWDTLEMQGLRIPQDISITGMDGLTEPALRGLTSIHFSCEAVGREAVRTAIGLLRGGEKPTRETVVPVHLIERSSVALPP